MKYDLLVPGFGTLRGEAKENVAEFLGVPFGHVSERFAESELVQPPNGVVDCTAQGPLCPQVEPYDDNYNGVPKEECAPLDLKYDEFKCLNMRMQIPLDPSTGRPIKGPDTGLPVVIWLHGGSNIAGTPYRGSSNATSWLQRAVELDRPFIIVSPHYRVGFFGWLPTDTAYNQAIGDQRRCVEWIRKYGPGFGADVTKISLVGQSAGASCAYAHLLDSRTTSIVSQIGLLSGHIGAQGLATREQYTRLAERAAKHLACTVSDLRTVKAADLVAAQADINVFAAIRPENQSETEQKKPNLRLIVSDCEHDGDFCADVPALVQGAKETQGLEDMEPTTERQYMTSFFTDLVFRTGANDLWHGHTPVFRQLCDAVNPYTPSIGNNHMVELHFILNGYNLHSPAIEAMQMFWTHLVTFGEPWDTQSQALWLPPQGPPQILSRAEAEQKRKTREIKNRAELVRLMRGWPA